MAREVNVYTGNAPERSDGARDIQHRENYRAHRRRGRIGWAVLVGVFIVLPTLVAAVYYGLIASDRYVSRAQITVRTAGQTSVGQMDSLLSGIVSGGGSSNEGYLVQEYIKSQEILNKLQGWLDLRQMWTQSSIDWVSRLEPQASDEDLLEYYQSMVSARYDTEKGVIHVEVQGYAPDDANALATSIIELSDTMVNRISDQIREDSLESAREEVKRAEERLQEARLAIKRFQNENGDLDPSETASAIGGIMADIQGKLSEVRTEISAKSSYMREDSAAIKALRAREAALEEQLRRERQRLTGRRDGQNQPENYSDLLVEYERLRIEQELAREAYTGAQAGLEVARAEASRKQMYLVSFVDPTMPDEAELPDRWLNVLIAFLGGSTAFAVVSLIGAAIREHARF